MWARSYGFFFISGLNFATLTESFEVSSFAMMQKKQKI